jgi:hypothetical protein
MLYSSGNYKIVNEAQGSWDKTNNKWYSNSGHFYGKL